MSKKLKILYVTSEAHPLVKTGGLADVSGSLPAALNKLGHDIRILIPGYREVFNQLSLEDVLKGASLYTPGGAVRLLQGAMPHCETPIYVVDHAGLYQRDGGPYLDTSGDEWTDNAIRFATLSRVASILGEETSPLEWQPDIIHCNDWQTGPAMAYLKYSSCPRAKTLITIHNIAYQGIYDMDLASEIWLPPESLDLDGAEFHGHISFLKAGLAFANYVTTVSTTYAREIQGVEHGCGMEGILRQRSDRLQGILNGINTGVWNPETDPYLAKNYNVDSVAGKAVNKKALQKEMGLDVDSDAMLFGVVSRLAYQKGLDLLAGIIPQMIKDGMQICLLGTGDHELEAKFSTLSTHQYKGRFASHIGYHEDLAHRIEAGSDAFIMPSRYEPCGLNQMYSLAYGTPPIVRRTGGLADSVIDAGVIGRCKARATGFIFDDATQEEMLQCIQRAATFFEDKEVWSKIIHNGMSRDFSWAASAKKYVKLYRRILSEQQPGA